MPVQGVRRMPSGNLLVTIVDGLVLEMTIAGDIVRQWYATGRYRDRAPPKDGIPVEAETFHHGVNLGPDGTMLLLSMEIREFDDWPGSVTDPERAARARESRRRHRDGGASRRQQGERVAHARPARSVPHHLRQPRQLLGRARLYRDHGLVPHQRHCLRRQATIPSWRRCAPRTASSSSTASPARCAGSSAPMTTGASRGPTSCSSRMRRSRGNSTSTTARSRRRAPSCASTTAITARSRSRRG